MKRFYLATYIHDHLAGATAAIDVLGRLEKTYANHPVHPLLVKLKHEFAMERATLKGLAGKFPLVTAVPRRVVAWFAGKGLQAKLRVDGFGSAKFRLFEALEALSVGIAGKRLLWRMLAEEAKRDATVSGIPYKKLINQAIHQRRSIEEFRLRAAAE